jgi:hypothetical protein
MTPSSCLDAVCWCACGFLQPTRTHLTDVLVQFDGPSMQLHAGAHVTATVPQWLTSVMGAQLMAGARSALCMLRRITECVVQCHISSECLTSPQL